MEGCERMGWGWGVNDVKLNRIPLSLIQRRTKQQRKYKLDVDLKNLHSSQPLAKFPFES